MNDASPARTWTFANVVSLVTLVCVLAVGYALYRTRRELRSEMKSLRFADYMAWTTSRENVFDLDVGVIQFLNSGYSIKLDSVSYEAGGVRLVGKIGNPKWLNISSLTLTLYADKNYYDEKERFLRSDDWNKVRDSLRVASVQVSVGVLLGGATAPFKATIPNVKQAGEKYLFTVAFSGERYLYTIDGP